jgi:thioredoxin-related protein
MLQIRHPITAFFLVAISASSASGQEVQWRTNYGSARHESAEKNRPLLIVFESEGCTWCRHMDATTFRDPRVVQLLNERFVPLKVHTGDDYADVLVTGFRVQAFPTIAVVSPQGKILDIQEGYQDPSALLRVLLYALASLGG